MTKLNILVTSFWAYRDRTGHKETLHPLLLRHPFPFGGRHLGPAVDHWMAAVRETRGRPLQSPSQSISWCVSCRPMARHFGGVVVSAKVRGFASDREPTLEIAETRLCVCDTISPFSNHFVQRLYWRYSYVTGAPTIRLISAFGPLQCARLR